jgi:exodeoxyribonuclease V alpha subunit
VPIGTFGVEDMAERTGNYQPDPGRPGRIRRQRRTGAGRRGRARKFVLRFDGGRLVMVPAARSATPTRARAATSGGAAGDFDLAYAITVHKSQGSEWPLVIALVDPAGGSVADRHFWYTAISRARTACLLIGDGAALAQQCGPQSLARRKTYLAELIRGDADASADR